MNAKRAEPIRQKTCFKTQHCQVVQLNDTDDVKYLFFWANEIYIKKMTIPFTLKALLDQTTRDKKTW